jgi:5'-nucleotidase
MKILVSNDDGYLAPGIIHLVQELEKIAQVIVIAPDRNRSGASNSLTLDAPLRVRQVRENIYYVNGTPTDCVHLGVTGLLKELPDIVVSGINKGVNLGDDVIYSGTIAAAMEGRFLGLPAVAISLEGDANHYKTAALVARNLVERLQNSNLPPKTILNVNIPDKPLTELGSYEITRLGTRHCAQTSVKRTDPRGNIVYWIGLPGEIEDAGPGTDFYAMRTGNISVTPLQIEWTNYEAFEQVSSWVKGLNSALPEKD